MEYDDHRVGLVLRGEQVIAVKHDAPLARTCRWPACEDDTNCMNGCKPPPSTEGKSEDPVRPFSQCEQCWQPATCKKYGCRELSHASPLPSPDPVRVADMLQSIEGIESMAFMCDAGPLKKCGDWKYLKRLVAALRTAPPQPTEPDDLPEGYALVPIVPTPRMIEAGCENNPTQWNDGTPDNFAADVANDVYVSMVSAARLEIAKASAPPPPARTSAPRLSDPEPE